MQARPTGYPERLAFEDNVDSRQTGRDRAGRIRGQIAGLARPRSAREIDVAVEPEGTDPSRARIIRNKEVRHAVPTVSDSWPGKRNDDCVERSHPCFLQS